MIGEIGGSEPTLALSRESRQDIWTCDAADVLLQLPKKESAAIERLSTSAFQKRAPGRPFRFNAELPELLVVQPLKEGHVRNDGRLLCCDHDVEGARPGAQDLLEILFMDAEAPSPGVLGAEFLVRYVIPLLIDVPIVGGVERS